MFSAIKACAVPRRGTDRPTKIIRAPPPRPTPVRCLPSSSGISILSPPTNNRDIDPLTNDATIDGGNSNDSASLPPPSLDLDYRYDHYDYYDLNQAPEAKEEHQDSYNILLSLLRRQRKLGTSLFAVKTTGFSGGSNNKTTAKSDSDYLLHLMCQSKGVNSSVVGLLVFANPRAPKLRSPRTGLTPLQVALLCNVSMEVITLLYEFETHKEQFCHETLSGHRVPLEVLLQPISNPCNLRKDSSRHALFMRFVEVWDGALEAVKNKQVWIDYYAAWKYMDNIGKGGYRGSGSGIGRSVTFHYQSFANLLHREDHAERHCPVKVDTMHTVPGLHSEILLYDENGCATVEGVQNLLRCLNNI